ncbi:MAG TPA: glycosyltransferase family 1 protein [Gaiellaceae bacterium]|nr:glycosyltransferase family 1 protein [Gaiellaceae bacterium]
MRVVVDVSPLSRPRTGIGNYLRGLVAGLTEAGAELLAFGPSGPRGQRRIRESLAGLPVELRLPLLPRAQVWRTAWSRVGRPPVETVVGPLDVFHFSDWMYPSQRGGVRATTVHDLVPLRFPEWVQGATLRMHGPKYENAARTCDRVFVNSCFTASEVVELLGLREERVVVAYPGIDPRFQPEGEQADLGGPYVLGVSTLEPRKNLPALVAAFAVLRQRRPELTLALAGLEGWEERPLAAEGVRLLGFVTDDELARLYRGASAFAYPSRFEGFGIPVVEALASGTPAVVSSHPSLDEACGDAPLRADPDDPEAFAAALEAALDAPRGAGVEHASRFTWRACGDAVLAGYESALTK